MTEMVTVGGIRYRKADAAEQNLQVDSKAHAERIASGEVPVGTTEKAWKAANPDKPAGRKADGARDDANGTKPLARGGAARGAAGDQPAGSQTPPNDDDKK